MSRSLASALAAQKSARIDGYLAKATLLPSCYLSQPDALYTAQRPDESGGQVGTQASPIFIANNAVHEYSSQAIVNETVGLKQFADAQVASQMSHARPPSWRSRAVAWCPL
jgi:hypothetical protein